MRSPAALLALLVLSAGFGCGGDEAPRTETAQPPSTETVEGVTTTGEGAGCSAAAADAMLVEQEGLAPAVAETRREVATAAAACDYERLAELAGERFTYSFGGGGDFAAFLRREEMQGSEPLRFLAGLLQRPYGTIETPQATQYVWPSAFAYESFDAVPAAERDALKPLYDEEDFADFERFGGYIGYRVGIAEDGEWLFFVAGD